MHTTVSFRHALLDSVVSRVMNAAIAFWILLSLNFSKYDCMI